MSGTTPWCRSSDFALDLSARCRWRRYSTDAGAAPCRAPSARRTPVMNPYAPPAEVTDHRQALDQIMVGSERPRQTRVPRAGNWSLGVVSRTAPIGTPAWPYCQASLVEQRPAPGEDRPRCDEACRFQQDLAGAGGHHPGERPARDRERPLHGTGRQDSPAGP